MKKLSRFKWDCNDQYVMLQERMIEELVEGMYISIKDHFLKAADLLGVKTDLSKGLNNIMAGDLQGLSFAYDIIAACYRHNYGKREGQLTLLWEEEYVGEWRGYWDDEIADLMGNNDFNRSILECLVYKNESPAISAKQTLIQLLDDRYGINWQRMLTHERSRAKDDTTSEENLAPFVESVEHLYGKNPFRILGLLINSENQTAHQEYQLLFNRAEVGRDVDIKKIYTLNPAKCDSVTIRNAYNALNSLEDRLKYRLFWFGAGDLDSEQAYRNMVNGQEEKAYTMWLESSDENDYFALQNIAIYKHLSCISKNPMAHVDPDNSWLDALSTQWGELLGDSNFWVHQEHMERRSGWLPQASHDDIKRTENNCWRDILNINVELAIIYWQKKQYVAVYNHLELIRASGFSRDAVVKAESDIIMFVESKVDEDCKNFIDALARDVKDVAEQKKIKDVCSEHRQKLQSHLLPLALQINNMDFDLYLSQCIRVRIAEVIREFAVIYYNNKLSDYLEAEELIALALSLLNGDDPEYYRMKADQDTIAKNARLAGYPNRTSFNVSAARAEEDNIIEYFEEGELIKAAREGDMDRVVSFLKSGADVNFRDEDGETALIAAAYKGHAVIAGILINAGAAIDIQDKSDPGPGYTALMWASHEGYDVIVGLLLETKADPDLQTDRGYTALMLAAQQGHYKTVLQLLNHDANVFVVNNDGETAMTLARKRKKGEIVDLLKPLYSQSGRSKNATGDTLLMHAAYNNIASLAKELLDSGVNIDSINVEGKTALICAACRGNMEIVRMLLDHGANIWIKDNRGMTAYKWAIYTKESEIARLIKQRSGIRGVFM
jgi:ankyrin repeat protein